MAFSLRAPFLQSEMLRLDLDKLAHQRELPGREVRQYAVSFDTRVRNRHSREQRLGVGVERMVVKRAHGRDLDKLAVVQYAYAVAEEFHHRKVMRDEEKRKAVLALQMAEQVDDLCLNGHIQRRDRFVRTRSSGSMHSARAWRRAGAAHPESSDGYLSR